MSNRFEGYFSGHKGAELFYQVWKVEEAIGTIVVTHGLAEHSECYNEFAQRMNKDQWQVVGWDLRGHGKSEGKRGYVSQFEHLELDLLALLNKISEESLCSDSPILFGHSMGGLIVTRTLLREEPPEVKALALSSPAFGLSLEVPLIKKKFAEWASQWLPQVTLNNEMDYSQLVQEEERMQQYANDPLRHEKISPRLFLGMVEGFEIVAEQAEKITAPLILQVAERDQVTSTQAALAFYDKVSSKKKELFVYNDSQHEVFNDIQREKVYNDLKVFLRRL